MELLPRPRVLMEAQAPTELVVTIFSISATDILVVSSQQLHVRPS